MIQPGFPTILSYLEQVSPPTAAAGAGSNDSNETINTTSPVISRTTPASAIISHLITLPQMLEEFSSLYNTNGRIGIYTREVTILFFIIFFCFYFCSTPICYFIW